ncbi:MAG TPA: hypothetical protein VIV12_00430 [Streptosporangiaceae bacterium]
MGPIVAEVEHVDELLARALPRQFDALIVLGDLALDLPVRVRAVGPPAFGDGELLQVGAVPAGEMRRRWRRRDV